MHTRCLTLLKLQLDTTRSSPAKTDITSLPYDIVLIILDCLDLTDRVCLGLASKLLAFKVTCAPRVPAIYKVRAGDPLGYHIKEVHESDQTWPPYSSLTPEWYTLMPRLAMGWVPKEKFKYCWKCHRIYPRDWDFYERKLSKQKAPGWVWKLNLTEQQWRRMSLEERRRHMISRWLTDNDLVHESLRPPTPKCNVYYPDLGVWRNCTPDERGPECPLCLERELRFSWSGPKSLFQVSMSTKVVLIGLVRLPIDLSIAAASTVGRVLRSPC